MHSTASDVDDVSGRHWMLAALDVQDASPTEKDHREVMRIVDVRPFRHVRLQELKGCVRTRPPGTGSDPRLTDGELGGPVRGSCSPGGPGPFPNEAWCGRGATTGDDRHQHRQGGTGIRSHGGCLPDAQPVGKRRLAPLGSVHGANVSATMRSTRFTSDRGFEVRDVPRPDPGPGETLVDVHRCGICGSDLHFHSGVVAPPDVCPGHEICGRVAAGSRDLPVGTPVVVEPIRSCGHCVRCRTGEPNLCAALEIIGSQLDGGFADAVLVPSASVHPVPALLDLDTAVLAEPLAVAVHGVDLAEVGPGDVALVLGAGIIGLLTAFVAVRRGAVVAVSARHDHQAGAALALGADAVDASEAAVRTAARRRRPDVVLETVGGDAATVDLALRAVRRGVASSRSGYSRNRSCSIRSVSSPRRCGSRRR